MTGLKKIKTAVLISGRGSNLYNLIKFSKKKKSPILIDLVVSNKKNAIGFKYIKLQGMTHFHHMYIGLAILHLSHTILLSEWLDDD